MLIAQISDTHLLEKGEAADWRLACLKRAVDTIAALSPAADLVIHTGDIAHNATAAEYALARAELQRLTMPVLATVGNRDRREAFLAAFSGRDLIPGGLALAQYGVVVDGVRMLAIDSLDDTRGFGTYPADRLADLERWLALSPDLPTLAFMHHPVLAIAELDEPLQFTHASEAAALAARLARIPRLLGVLAGHIHRPATAEQAGVRLSTMPAIATDLRKGSYAPDLADVPILHLHRLMPDGLHTEPHAARHAPAND
ncbi:MAG: metallophosphoesterase [Hyphomicrobiaceae bacterium]